LLENYSWTPEANDYIVMLSC